MEKKAHVTYWSDFSCPFCYIGDARLKRVAKEEGIELDTEMKAFRLDPNAPAHAETDTVVRFAAKYGLSMDEARDRVGMISSLGKSEGIDFRYAETRFTATMDAHRLAKFAVTKGKGAEVIDGLFDAYFTKNLELADRRVLDDVARKAGLDVPEVNRMLDSDRFREDVLEDEREAHSMGIFAVPYFLIGRAPVSGAAPDSVFRNALRNAAGGDGPSCGPDGCRI